MKTLLLAVLLLPALSNAAVPGIVDSQGAPLFQSVNISSTDANGLFRSICTTNMTQTEFPDPQTTFRAAVTGSTITLVTGGHALVTFSGTAGNSAASVCGINIYVDGNFVSPWNGTTGITSYYAPNTGYPVSFSVIIPLTPGSHTFSLTGNNITPNGACYLPWDSAAYSHKAQFCAMSLP